MWSCSLILALVMVLSLVSCSKEKGPDSTITAFCNAMKTYDTAAMKNCVVGGSEIEDDFSLSEEMPAGILEHFVKLAGKMSYSITASEVNETTATVTVKFNYSDITPIMTATMGEYLAQAFALAFSGASDETMDTLFETIFAEKSASVEPTTAEKTVIFSCEKTDSGWKISDIPEDALHVLTCNIASAFEGLANLGGSGSSADSEK